MLVKVGLSWQDVNVIQPIRVEIYIFDCVCQRDSLALVFQMQL